MILQRVEERWVGIPTTRMPSKNNHIRDTMFTRADPVIFRIVALGLAVCVAGSDMMLAGAWSAIVAACVLVGAACLLVPAAVPKDNFRRNIRLALDAARRCPLWIRITSVVSLVVAIALVDYYGRLELGREFNIFLIPIFLASLLFGMPVAIVTWLLSFLAVYVCVIPPKYSLVIDEPKDIAELVGFFYLGLITLTVPVLIRASSAVEKIGTRFRSHIDAPRATEG